MTRLPCLLEEILCIDIVVAVDDRAGLGINPQAPPVLTVHLIDLEVPRESERFACAWLVHQLGRDIGERHTAAGKTTRCCGPPSLERVTSEVCEDEPEGRRGRINRLGDDRTGSTADTLAWRFRWNVLCRLMMLPSAATFARIVPLCTSMPRWSCRISMWVTPEWALRCDPFSPRRNLFREGRACRGWTRCMP